MKKVVLHTIIASFMLLIIGGGVISILDADWKDTAKKAAASAAILGACWYPISTTAEFAGIVAESKIRALINNLILRGSIDYTSFSPTQQAFVDITCPNVANRTAFYTVALIGMSPAFYFVYKWLTKKNSAEKIAQPTRSNKKDNLKVELMHIKLEKGQYSLKDVANRNAIALYNLLLSKNAIDNITGIEVWSLQGTSNEYPEIYNDVSLSKDNKNIHIESYDGKSHMKFTMKKDAFRKMLKEWRTIYDKKPIGVTFYFDGEEITFGIWKEKR